MTNSTDLESLFTHFANKTFIRDIIVFIVFHGFLHRIGIICSYF